MTPDEKKRIEQPELSMIGYAIILAVIVLMVLLGVGIYITILK